MSKKMTEQYSNQNLINLAKQQYQEKQTQNIPSEIIKLTSGGIVYPKDHILRSGQIEMRYMTAYDEDILTNPSYINEGVVLDKLIDTLIVSDVKFEELALIDKDGLILSARMLSYGTTYPVEITDPKTNKKLNRDIDLSKIKSKTSTLISDDNGEFTYKFNDNTLKWIFPKVKDTFNSISEFLLLIITEINGTRNKTEIENFIRYKFLITESKKFQKYITDNTPSTLLEYEFEGEDGSTFTAGFPIGPDFFWP
tara:strand:- start:2877 stop:3635 length:759 start_codon:yes stop_codon:yes gene_type:complete